MGCLRQTWRQIYGAVTSSCSLVIWITMNYVIFRNHYTKYKNAPEHIYLRNIIGRGLCISRASAAMLNVSCCILVLSMCRSLNMFLHYFFSLVSRRALVFWIKNVKSIHFICAYSVIFESVAHIIAHCVNAVNFSRYYDFNHPSLNWAKYYNQPAWEMILTSVVGVTGILMICFLSFMFVTSCKCFREEHYQIFWVVHHLYLPFLILLLCHPMSGILKELAYPHNTTNCLEKRNQNLNFLDKRVQNFILGKGNNSLCDTESPFVTMKSETWLWITPPFLLMFFDRVFWSIKRNWKKLHVLEVSRLPGSVIHLVLQSPSRNFFCKPGQYILLQCPMISKMEWHPFSVMSFCSGEQPSLSVLIRAKGDWTEKLLGCVLVPFIHKMYMTELLSKEPNKLITFHVDGPFRSPMEDVLNSSIAVCIAAGIGITPFLGILNYLLGSSVNNSPRQLHLFWVLQDTEQLLWCSKLLCKLHEKYWQENRPDKFTIQVYITKDNAARIQRIMNSNYDCKMLIRRIWRGRPKWSEIFNHLKEMYPGRTVDVYASGPKGLVSEIGSWCKNTNGRGLAITFSQEVF